MVFWLLPLLWLVLIWSYCSSYMLIPNTTTHCSQHPVSPLILYKTRFNSHLPSKSDASFAFYLCFKTISNNKPWLCLDLIQCQVTHISNPKIGVWTSPIIYYIPTTFAYYYKLIVGCNVGSTTSSACNTMILLFT